MLCFYYFHKNNIFQHNLSKIRFYGAIICDIVIKKNWWIAYKNTNDPAVLKLFKKMTSKLKRGLADTQTFFYNQPDQM